MYLFVAIFQRWPRWSVGTSSWGICDSNPGPGSFHPGLGTAATDPLAFVSRRVCEPRMMELHHGVTELQNTPHLANSLWSGFECSANSYETGRGDWNRKWIRWLFCETQYIENNKNCRGVRRGRSWDPVRPKSCDIISANKKTFIQNLRLLVECYKNKRT